MRLLLIVLNYTGQGTYWRAYHLGRELGRRGHQVTLVATEPRARSGVRVQQRDGLTLVESPDLFHGPLRSGWDPWNVANRIAWLRDKRFDLVHAFESRPTVIFPALYASRRWRVPLVMDWADWFGKGGSVEERPNPLVRLVLRPVETFFEEGFRSRAAAHTVICSTLEEKARRLGLPAGSIVRLPNGSDVERLRPASQAEARQALGLPSDGPIIGYLGSIFLRDAGLMARAFDEVCAQTRSLPLNPVRLLMIGRSKIDLRPLVRCPELLIQTGYVDDDQLGLYLAACDLLWLPLADSPANRGRFPLKLTDYLAAGRPVVASAVGDVGEIFAADTVGIATAPDPAEFARASLVLLADPQRRQEMGRRARLLAETRYSWRRLAEQLESLYGGLIGDH